MKIISLNLGMVAVVDDEDFEFLNQWKWHAAGTGNARQYFYATRQQVNPDGTLQTVYMHVVVMRAARGQMVDHRDRTATLDNRKENLRLANKSQNGANAKLRCDRTSGLKGVSWNKRAGQWKAQIGNNPRRGLGYFEDKKDAAEAYDLAAVRQFGEFALTNKTLGLL